MLYTDPESNEIKMVNISRIILSNNKINCGDHYMAKITKKSPKSYKNAVHMMACYFRTEFNYDFVQYSPDDDSDYEAWLFFDFLGNAFGACCFRNNGKHELCNGLKWKLDWIWFHPFSRRSGILTEAWKNFRDMYDIFLLEPPLSYAMRKFCLKNYRSILEKYYNAISVSNNILDIMLKHNILVLDYYYLDCLYPDAKFTIYSESDKQKEHDIIIKEIIIRKDQNLEDKIFLKVNIKE